MCWISNYTGKGRSLFWLVSLGQCIAAHSHHFQNPYPACYSSLSSYLILHCNQISLIFSDGDGCNICLWNVGIYTQVDETLKLRGLISTFSSTLKMEAVGSSETSVFICKSTWQCNLEALHQRSLYVDRLCKIRFLYAIKRAASSAKCKIAKTWNLSTLVVLCLGIIQLDRRSTKYTYRGI
jgi:hypothetical protein